MDYVAYDSDKNIILNACAQRRNLHKKIKPLCSRCDDSNFSISSYYDDNEMKYIGRVDMSNIDLNNIVEVVGTVVYDMLKECKDEYKEEILKILIKKFIDSSREGVRHSDD